MNNNVNDDEPFLINPSTMPSSDIQRSSRHVNGREASGTATGTATDNAGDDEDEDQFSYASNTLSNAPSSVVASFRPSLENPSIEGWNSELDDATPEGTPKTIRCLAFSPCGQFLAYGGDDRKVTIYSVLTDRKIHERKISGAVLSISYSPPSVGDDYDKNGDFLWIGGDDERVTVIDTSTYRVVKSIDMAGDVEVIAHNPTNNHVACGGTSQVITIFDSKSYKVLKEIEMNRGTISHLAYSMDGKSLASGGETSQLVVHNTTTYDVSKTFENSGYAYHMVYSPNKKYLAVAQSARLNRQGDKKIIVYQLPSYKIVKEIQRKMDVNGIAFSSDSSQIVVVGDEKKVTVYDSSRFGIVKEYDNGSAFLTVKYATDTFACGGYDAKIKLFSGSTFEVIAEYYEDTGVDVAHTTVPTTATATTVTRNPSITPVASVESTRSSRKVKKQGSLIISREEDDSHLNEIEDILKDIEKNEPEEEFLATKPKTFKSYKKERDPEAEKEQYRKDCLFLLTIAGILILCLAFLIGLIILVR